MQALLSLDPLGRNVLICGLELLARQMLLCDGRVIAAAIYEFCVSRLSLVNLNILFRALNIVAVFCQTANVILVLALIWIVFERRVFVLMIHLLTSCELSQGNCVGSFAS